MATYEICFLGNRTLGLVAFLQLNSELLETELYYVGSAFFFFFFAVQCILQFSCIRIVPGFQEFLASAKGHLI